MIGTATGKLCFLGFCVRSRCHVRHAEMPSFLGLSCLEKLCSSEKGKGPSPERASLRGSHGRTLVIEDLSVPETPHPARHRHGTVTYLFYLYSSNRGPPELRFSSCDSSGKYSNPLQHWAVFCD